MLKNEKGNVFNIQQTKNPFHFCPLLPIGTEKLNLFFF